MDQYITGQRWSSSNEPELGVGFLLSSDNFSVTIFFPAADCYRQYNIDSAPIYRVVYSVGDRVVDKDGNSHTISSIMEDKGLLTYISGTNLIPEGELSDTAIDPEPFERLKNGDLDSPYDFLIRREISSVMDKVEHSKVKGYLGAKIDLLDHQLYIAEQISQATQVNHLLSDETGLGKTIEAGLTIHRLLKMGRVSRVVIVVPEPLIYQWFVEFYRKFNLNFTILDEVEYIGEVIEDDQLFIISYSKLESSEESVKTILNGEFDLLVVDEAHHISDGDERIQIFSLLSNSIINRLFISATPEQVGVENHFRRLQLLDPIKYSNYDQFCSEMDGYSKISSFLKLIEKVKKSDLEQFVKSSDLYKSRERVLNYLLESCKSKKEFIEQIIYLFSVGRTIFRNSRRNIKGFPERNVNIVPLPDLKSSDNSNGCERIVEKCGKSLNSNVCDKIITKLRWLANLLKSDKKGKYLLICSSKEKVITIDRELNSFINIKKVMFHEDLPLVKRDRNSAYFSEEDGARVLICSEIGSEGRNFQFANNLILFDLPLNPELIEQRIGRVDRIGQKKGVNIYIPFIKDCEEESLVEIYHNGMGIFEKNLSGSFQIFNKLSSKIEPITSSVFDSKKVKSLVKDIKLEVSQFSKEVEDGRDLLLERGSYNYNISREVIKEIDNLNNLDIERYTKSLMDIYGVTYDPFDKGIYKFNFDFQNNTDLPTSLLRNEYQNFTFRREKGLEDERLDYLTFDHPFIEESTELLLQSPLGTTTYGVIDGDSEGFIIHVRYRLGSPTLSDHQLKHYLDSSYIELSINHLLEEVDLDLDSIDINEGSTALFSNKKVINRVIKPMESGLESMVENRISKIEGIIKTKVKDSYSRRIENGNLKLTLGLLDSEKPITQLRDEMEQLIESIDIFPIVDSILLIRSV